MPLAAKISVPIPPNLSNNEAEKPTTERNKKWATHRKTREDQPMVEIFWYLEESKTKNWKKKKGYAGIEENGSKTLSPSSIDSVVS